MIFIPDLGSQDISYILLLFLVCMVLLGTILILPVASQHTYSCKHWDLKVNKVPQNRQPTFLYLMLIKLKIKTALIA